jgi:ElaB/YqjD/DUF883 family membrane-anchored ribosome-binding protein
MQTTVKEYGATGDTMSKDMTHLSDVASKAASDVKGAAAQVATHAAQRARDSVRTFVDEGRTMAEENLAATQKWFGDQTRDYPLRTLAVAAGIGLVIGMLIARR